MHYLPYVLIKFWKLSNLLRVPKIKKNLISISQLTTDNDVVEFHYSYYLVKDKQTGKMLLKGTLDRGLYVLNDSPVEDISKNKAFTNVKLVLESNKTSKKFTRDYNVSSFSNNTINANKHMLDSQYVSSLVKSNKVDLWHGRLGHPVKNVVTTMMKVCNEDCSMNKQFDFCSACQFGKKSCLTF